MDGGDLEQERRVANQTNDDRGDMETEIGDSGRDEASGSANEDKTGHVDLVVPARKIKNPSPVWKCADRPCPRRRIYFTGVWVIVRIKG